jgi:four helix bundle protein
MKIPNSNRSNSKEGSKSKVQDGQRRVRYDVGESDFATLTLREDEDGAVSSKQFDLEERTAQFGERLVKFSKRIPRIPGNNRLIDQLVGAATSVGANYIEATESVSKKDFKNSISRCKKEAKESRFFLRKVAAAEPSLASDAREFYREANELVLIFAAIYRK